MRYDEDRDIIGTRPARAGGLGPLFDPPHVPHTADPDTDRLVERAALIFRAFLQRRGYEGGFLGECREEFKRNGIITGGEAGRTLSWMSRVPKAAGAVSSGKLEWYNKNRQVRWLHPNAAR